MGNDFSTSKVEKATTPLVSYGEKHKMHHRSPKYNFLLKVENAVPHITRWDDTRCWDSHDLGFGYLGKTVSASAKKKKKKLRMFCIHSYKGTMCMQYSWKPEDGVGFPGLQL